MSDKACGVVTWDQGGGSFFNFGIPKPMTKGTDQGGCRWSIFVVPDSAGFRLTIYPLYYIYIHLISIDAACSGPWVWFIRFDSHPNGLCMLFIRFLENCQRHVCLTWCSQNSRGYCCEERCSFREIWIAGTPKFQQKRSGRVTCLSNLRRSQCLRGEPSHND